MPILSLESPWSVQLDEYVTVMAWSPNGQFLAVGTAGGPVALIDGKTGQIVRTLKGHAMGTLSLGWHSSGRLLASGGQDGKARIYDVTTGEVAATLVGGASWVEHIAWSSESGLLATGAGKKLKFWKSDGTLVLEVDPHPNAIAGIQWHPSGHLLATISFGGVRFWSPKNPICQRISERRELLITMRWSPSGRWIACGQNDPTLFICNTASEDHLQMQGYEGKVDALAWDTIGQTLATAGGPSAVVWDFAGKGPARTKPRTLTRHTGKIVDIAFDPKNRVLATGGDDGMLLVWRVKAEEVVGAAPPGKPISKIAWRPDGDLIAMGDQTGIVTGFSTRGI